MEPCSSWSFERGWECSIHYLVGHTLQVHESFEWLQVIEDLLTRHISQPVAFGTWVEGDKM